LFYRGRKNNEALSYYAYGVITNIWEKTFSSRRNSKKQIPNTKRQKTKSKGRNPKREIPNDKSQITKSKAQIRNSKKGRPMHCSTLKECFSINDQRTTALYLGEVIHSVYFLINDARPGFQEDPEHGPFFLADSRCRAA
jgi:hypothetical protein